MSHTEPVPYANPLRRTRRRLVVAGLVAMAVAAPAAAVAVHVSQAVAADESRGLSATCTLVAVLSGLIGFSLVLTGLTGSSACAANDRGEDDWRRYRPLAEWAYTEAEWRRFVAAEGRRLWLGCWWLVCLAGALPAAVGATFAMASPHHKAADLAITAGVVLGVTAAAAAGEWASIAAHQRRLSAGPGSAVVGLTGMAFAGDFTYWGGKGLSLESVDLVDGPVPLLRFVVRSGQPVGTRSTVGTLVALGLAADVALLLTTGRSGNMTVVASDRRDPKAVYYVPVPDGKAGEAHAVLRAILRPGIPVPVADRPAPWEPPAKAVPNRAVPARAAPAVYGVTPIGQIPVPLPPPPVRRPPTPARWWAATAALAVVGLGLAATWLAASRSLDAPGVAAVTGAVVAAAAAAVTAAGAVRRANPTLAAPVRG